MNLTAKVVDTSSYGWKWSYQLILRNNTLEPVDDYHDVLFLDADGFIIEKTPRKVEISAGETKTFLDTCYILLPGGQRVKSLKFE
jgi:hypothetical protein